MLKILKLITARKYIHVYIFYIVDKIRGKFLAWE